MIVNFFFFFMFGCCIGSFLLVIATRVPQKRSFIQGRSHCEQCRHVLGPFDLIPIFSYIYLKGSCRYCRIRLPAFYIIYEMVAGIIFCLLMLRYSDSVYPLIFNSLLYIILFLMAAVDQQYLIIPDSLQACFGILLFFFHWENQTLLHPPYLIGALMMLVFSLVAMKCSKDGLGGGDVKLMFLIGYALGFHAATLVLFIAASVALLYFMIQVKRKQLSLTAQIPFGPFLVLAFFTVREYIMVQ